VNQGIAAILQEDPLAASIFQRIVSSGTISIGELYVTPKLDLDKLSEALGKLESSGLISHTGHYYSLSAVGAAVAKSLSRPSTKQFGF
jgi:hypothetical protein